MKEIKNAPKKVPITVSFNIAKPTNTAAYAGMSSSNPPLTFPCPCSVVSSSLENVANPAARTNAITIYFSTFTPEKRAAVLLLPIA